MKLKESFNLLITFQSDTDISRIIRFEVKFERLRKNWVYTCMTLVSRILIFFKVSPEYFLLCVCVKNTQISCLYYRA